MTGDYVKKVAAGLLLAATMLPIARCSVADPDAHAPMVRSSPASGVESGRSRAEVGAPKSGAGVTDNSATGLFQPAVPSTTAAFTSTEIRVVSVADWRDRNAWLLLALFIWPLPLLVLHTVSGHRVVQVMCVTLEAVGTLATGAFLWAIADSPFWSVRSGWYCATAAVVLYLAVLATALARELLRMVRPGAE